MSDPNAPDSYLDRFFLATGAHRIAAALRPASVVPADPSVVPADPSVPVERPSLNRKFSSLTDYKVWVDKVRGSWAGKD